MTSGSRRASGRGAQRVLIAALVCGSFGIGVSEFLVMGLLPEIAADLAPAHFSAHPDSAVAAAGGMASGYALGVVAGMVLMPVVLRRLSERAIVAVCAAAMLLLTVLTLAAPTLPVAIALRFIAALPHASYIGLASLMAARALGSRHHGRGAAIVVGGLTLSNVLGVPVLIAFGSEAGWRAALVVCAALFAVPLLALARIVPRAAEGAEALRVQRARGGGRRLVSAIVMITSLASGAFAVSTFVAPVSAHVQGVPPSIPVSVLMLAFGVGMNIGNFGGGVIADRSAPLILLLSGASGLLGAGLLLAGATTSALAIAGMLLVGAGLGSLTPGAQVVYLRLARRRPRLAASLAPGTINLGSFVGALAGGAGLAAFGAQAVVIAALGLYGIGLVLLAGGGAARDKMVSSAVHV